MYKYLTRLEEKNDSCWLWASLKSPKTILDEEVQRTMRRAPYLPLLICNLQSIYSVLREIGEDVRCGAVRCCDRHLCADRVLREPRTRGIPPSLFKTANILCFFKYCRTRGLFGSLRGFLFSHLRSTVPAPSLPRRLVLILVLARIERIS